MTTTDKAAPKLKRCPACGYHTVGLGAWWPREEAGVSCDHCDMRGPVTASEADAIAAWNALPRRKRVKRKKAEAAVTQEEAQAAVSELRRAATVFGRAAVWYMASEGGSEAERLADADMTRGEADATAAAARLMALLGHAPARPDEGGAASKAAGGGA